MPLFLALCIPSFVLVCLSNWTFERYVCLSYQCLSVFSLLICLVENLASPNLTPQCKLNVSLKFNNKLTTALIRYLKVSDCSYLWCWTCCDLNKVKEIAERCCWYWYYRFFSFYLLSLAIFSQLVVAIFYFFFLFLFPTKLRDDRNGHSDDSKSGCIIICAARPLLSKRGKKSMDWRLVHKNSIENLHCDWIKMIFVSARCWL